MFLYRVDDDYDARFYTLDVYKAKEFAKKIDETNDFVCIYRTRMDQDLLNWTEFVPLEDGVEGRNY